MGQYAFLVVDLGIIAVVAISSLLAASRGLIREVLVVLPWIAAIGAILFAIVFAPSVFDVARNIIASKTWADVATVGIIFSAVLVMASVLSHFVGVRLDGANMGLFDRVSGFLFGLGRGVAVMVIAYIGYSWFVAAGDRPAWLEDSRLIPYLDRAKDWLTDFVPELFRDAGLVAASIRGGMALGGFA